MKKEQEYNCVYTAGNGLDYEEGVWKIKTLTKKTLIIEKISEQEGFANYEKGKKIRCAKNSGNPLRDWQDGTFTIYPQQAGTPYLFVPIDALP